MLRNFKKRKEGFTIIEVLIVLAIAGLILLIVFLAVPALQRNARNTERKNDVASILGAVSEFVNNNSGTLPTTAAVSSDGTLTISGAAGSNSSTAKLGYYTGGVSIAAAGAPPATNTTTTDTVIIYKGAECNSLGTIAVTSTSAREVAANYTLETDAKICQGS